jgi:hypothetical protein
MNCSDNVSSDEVLPEENTLLSRRAGMGCANINQLLTIMKSDVHDFVIIYDPSAFFRNTFLDTVIIPSPCECAGRQK